MIITPALGRLCVPRQGEAATANPNDFAYTAKLTSASAGNLCSWMQAISAFIVGSRANSLFPEVTLSVTISQGVANFAAPDVVLVHVPLSCGALRLPYGLPARLGRSCFHGGFLIVLRCSFVASFSALALAIFLSIRDRRAQVCFAFLLLNRLAGCVCLCLL